MRDESKITVFLDDGQSERRGKKRLAAKTPFVAGSFSGRLVDMSETGLGVEVGKPFPVRLRTTVTLEIPTVRPSFRGEVRWCRLTNTIRTAESSVSPIYRAGIALLDP